MQTLLNTLYLTLSGYLHLENDTLRFEVERETRLRVPLHHIGSVVCFGDVLVSPAVMGRLAEDGKSLVILDRNGHSKRALKGPSAATFCFARRSLHVPNSRSSHSLTPKPASRANSATAAMCCCAERAMPTTNPTPQACAKPPKLSPAICAI